jgi:hypothetical protein
MSRASVVGLLIAAEVLIVGMAIYAVGHGRASFAAGLHHVDFTAAPIAPVAAGSQPRVVIDDAASRVQVGVSPDELVHVSDLTQMRGAVYSSGTYPQLRVTRTSDGVRIERPSAGRLSIEIFGFSKRSIQVEVPRDSHVEVADCAGADVFGIAGGASVHSNDGHVTLTDMQGSIDARSDDGYVSATNVRGDRLGLVSTDGHLALKNVAVGSLLAQTRDGRIEADALSVTDDATLQTDDGSIALKLEPNANLTIDASTRDGRIVVDGNSVDRDDTAQRTIRLGAATGKMKVATLDGSIHILTNGDSLQ